MTERELQQLIDRVSDRFEQVSGFRVLQRARKALLVPALPHLDDVRRELDRRTITVQSLEGLMQQILNNTLDDIQQRHIDYIDERAIERSMARYCPYLFWC